MQNFGALKIYKRFFIKQKKKNTIALFLNFLRFASSTHNPFKTYNIQKENTKYKIEDLVNKQFSSR